MPAETIATVGLPPTASQAAAAAWMGLDRSRLSQLKGSDKTFPVALRDEVVRAVTGTGRAANLWARDDIIRWAQQANPMRYSDDQPLPLFPLSNSPLQGKTWTATASGAALLGDVPCGWRLLRCEHSYLVHVFASADASESLLGAVVGDIPLVHADLAGDVAAQIKDSSGQQFPEFFTMVFTLSGDVSTLVAATVTAADADSGGVWLLGHRITDPADVAELLGYSLPWFPSAAADAARVWVPGAPVSAAVFDPDALLLHQAAWWLTEHPEHPLATDIGLIAAVAAGQVARRYAPIPLANGWEWALAVDVPAGIDLSLAGDPVAAADRVLAARGDEPLPVFLMSYVTGLAQRQLVRIPVTGLPGLFAAAVDESSADLVVEVSAVGATPVVPVAATVTVPAVMNSQRGTVQLSLHVDNSLSVAGLAFPSR